MLSTLYFDYEVKFDRGEMIQHLFTLFNNEHSAENVSLGTEMVQQYISNNYEELKFNQEKQQRLSKKKHGKHGKSTMEAKGEGAGYGDTYMQEATDESVYGDDDSVIL